jgi:L-ascorbate peroxidase
MLIWEEFCSEIASLEQSKGCGPILILLSWHDAGTYDKNSKTGGDHPSRLHEIHGFE